MAASGGLGLNSFQTMIGPAHWQALLAAGTLRSFQPGRLILRQGDPGGFLLALEAGRVKLLARAADGAQLMLTVRGGGHLLGELASEDSGRRTASVEALDRCTARHLSRADFERFLARHHLEATFRQYVTDKFEQAVGRQVDLAHRQSVRRIARLLYDLVQVAPADLVDPMVIPFTQEGLATSLGLARSTVADQLARLRQSGALGPGPHLVVADLARLAEWADA